MNSAGGLDYAAITRILPHRFPFLLVDRVLEMEPDRRIVGIKHVSASESFLYREPGCAPALPSAILLESVAQVGAILILSKPENHDKFIFLTGITRVRYRRPVYAGETVSIEAVVRRLRGPAGQMSGTASVDGEIVGQGSMTFVLIPHSGPPAGAGA